MVNILRVSRWGSIFYREFLSNMLILNNRGGGGVAQLFLIHPEMGKAVDSGWR